MGQTTLLEVFLKSKNLLVLVFGIRKIRYFNAPAIYIFHNFLNIFGEKIFWKEKVQSDIKGNVKYQMYTFASFLTIFPYFERAAVYEKL